MIRTGRSLSMALFLATAMVLSCFGYAGAVERVGISGDDNGLLQFRAGNHILGFMPDRAFLASPDHALGVRFVGTAGVIPRSEGNGSMESGAGTAALGRVVYQELWDGISLAYEASKDGIGESTYHVAPGADVAKIRLSYNVPVALLADGSLRFRFEKGFITESAPVAWQDIDGRRIPVNATFRVSGSEVGFTVGEYDSEHPLVIDPTYSWHSFYSLENTDAATAVTVDSGGNIYVTGRCKIFSTIFVVKLSGDGAEQWHRYFGSNYSQAFAIALDGSGNIFLTGWSNSGWNGPAGQLPLHAYTGSTEIFVLKLDNGGEYQWHAFYGWYGGDEGCGLVLDNSGNLFVTGISAEGWNGPAGEAPLHAHSGGPDIFVLKLGNSGAYQWHTFYGSNDGVYGDYGYGIAMDGSGSVYLAGLSQALWNGPAGQPPLNDAFNGNINNSIFVLKLDNSGAYQWHTFYGSWSSDTANGIAVDGGGNVYVSGYSDVPWDGPAGQSPKNAFNGYYFNNTVVLKLDSGGGYLWHTFYGSSANDQATGIAVNGSGDVYVTGWGNGDWSGPAGELPWHPYSGTSDLFILNLNSSGSYRWHTFFGSSSVDEAYGIAMDGSGNLYVIGSSLATWNGPANQPPLNSLSGNGDFFVLKLNDKAGQVTVARIVRGGNPFNNYSNVQDAYVNALSGDVIQARAVDVTGDLNMTGNINVSLRGGYDGTFLTNPDCTAIVGSITIGGSGGVVVENLVVKGP